MSSAWCGRSSPAVYVCSSSTTTRRTGQARSRTASQPSWRRSRFCTASGRRGSIRRFISRGGSLYAQLLLGLPVRDLTGGFKCYRRAVLEALPLEEIHSRGYAFQIETTYRAVRKGFRVKEVPITFVDRIEGGSKMSQTIVL